MSIDISKKIILSICMVLSLFAIHKNQNPIVNIVNQIHNIIKFTRKMNKIEWLIVFLITFMIFLGLFFSLKIQIIVVIFCFISRHIWDLYITRIDDRYDHPSWLYIFSCNLFLFLPCILTIYLIYDINKILFFPYLLFIYIIYQNQLHFIRPKPKNHPNIYVYLSWTKGRPRENAAMQGVIKALKYYNISFFDYTEYQTGNLLETEIEIEKNIKQAVKKSNYSIEIISSDIMEHYWVEYEKDLLRFSNLYKRFFLILDRRYLNAYSPYERNIIRIDFSDGKTGVHRNDDFFNREYSDCYFYQSEYYMLLCADFVKKNFLC